MMKFSITKSLADSPRAILYLLDSNVHGYACGQGQSFGVLACLIDPCSDDIATFELFVRDEIWLRRSHQ
jgi:hypothetical protein